MCNYYNTTYVNVTLPYTVIMTLNDMFNNTNDSIPCGRGNFSKSLLIKQMIHKALAHLLTSFHLFYC